MPINALLCRWAEGWREVLHPVSIAAYGRREAFLSLGAVQTRDEVDRVGGMQLSVVANPRMAIAADLAPMGQADKPYRTFNVGDTITVPDYGGGTISQRVRALTGAEDDNGEITYSPELGDLILEEQERTLQAVKKMADGTLEGDSPVAQPRLKPQIIRVWAPPANPPSGGGFTAESTAKPTAHSSSRFLRSVPAGDGDYELTRFWCRPATGGASDGTPVVFELWQQVPGGDGSHSVAVVDIGHSFQAGVEYVGTIYDSSITFGPEWGIFFQVAGDMTGDVYVAAEFEGGGQLITVEWDYDTLRVTQHEL